MMIALPNCDASWTVTLFMPVNEFAKLESPDKLMKFFETYFFDAIDLIGKEKLIMDFFASKPSPLISVKVSRRRNYPINVMLNLPIWEEGDSEQVMTLKSLIKGISMVELRSTM